MYFFNYYLEFKYRFFLIFFCWFLILCVCYLYKEVLLFIFINFSNYKTFPVFIKSYFIFTDVTEIFSVYIKFIFFISTQITLIKILYHSLLFFLPGFYKFECKKLKFIFKIILIFWFVSIIFLNNFFVMYSWKFFLSYSEQQTGLPKIPLHFEAKINEYFNFYISLYYLCVINCQFLVFLVLFINNLSKNLIRIKTFRKIFYFIFLIFSTLVTPPDIFSQLVLSFLLIFTYETLVFIKIYSKKY